MWMICSRKTDRAMVNVEPIVKRDGRYNIAETCRLLGIHRNTLLRYERLGIIHSGLRRSTARKFFTGGEILRFWKASI